MKETNQKKIAKCKNCHNETYVDDIYGWCEPCNKIRKRAYDAYVDPLGFYRSKSIENYD